MKKLLTGLAVLIATPVFWSSQVLAQETQLNAIEMFMCEYVKGKGAKDLDKVVDKWNKWQDKHGKVPYSAWTLTPAMTTPDIKFDIAWLGAWSSADFGEGAHLWNTQGGGMQADFDAVLECKSHTLALSQNVKEAPSGWPFKSSLVTFGDCTVAEGKTPNDVATAQAAWSQYLSSKGSKAGYWNFYPAFGDGDVAFDYKLVGGFEDYRSLGKDLHNFGQGGGWMKEAEIFGGVVSCDVERVYNTRLRRDGGVGSR
jgi:hypothetical protein